MGDYECPLCKTIHGGLGCPATRPVTWHAHEIVVGLPLRFDSRGAFNVEPDTSIADRTRDARIAELEVQVAALKGWNEAEEIEKAENRAVELEALLRRAQAAHFHMPDSDGQEYCNGCGRSPYNNPPHQDDCLVVEIARVLRNKG